MTDLTFHIMNPKMTISKIKNIVKGFFSSPEIANISVKNGLITGLISVNGEVYRFFSDNDLKSLKGQNRCKWLHAEEKTITLIKKDLE